MSTIQVRIEGAAELQSALRTLGDRVERRVVRKAAKQSMHPVLQTARALAPKADQVEPYHRRRGTQPGDLAAAIVLLGPYRRRGAVRTRVGFDTKSHPWLTDGEHFIPAAVEYGHDLAPGHPFMRPAHDRNQQAVVTTFMAQVKAGIDAIWRRAGRKLLRTAKNDRTFEQRMERRIRREAAG